MPRTVSRVDSIEIGSDMDFERLWVRTEHWLWGISATLVLAGILGLFGRGPLSKAAIGSDQDPARLEYERFARFNTPAHLKVKLNGVSGADSGVKVLLSKELVETLKLPEASPGPALTQISQEGLLLTF